MSSSSKELSSPPHNESIYSDPEVAGQPRVTNADLELEKLGYKQELKRSFSIWSLIAFGIVTLTPNTAIANTLQLPLEVGGPQVLVWGYIIVSVFTMLVATSLAEISAAFPPTSGGMLSWSYLLPKSQKVKILASWYTGYFNIFAQIAFAASASFQGTVMVIGMATLQHENYVPERYHYVLASIGFIVLFTLTNIYGNKYHSNSTFYLLIFNVVTIVAIMITLLATTPKRQDAKFIFTKYTNYSGFTSHSYVFIIGLLQSAYTFTGYDACTHLAEEAESKNSDGTSQNIIPKALVTVVGSSIIYGFVFVIVICSVLTDIDGLISSPTGSAFIQLLLDCTQNTPATVFLTLIPALGALFAAETMTLANSRTIYSFARDGAFVFPKFFSKVSSKYDVPIPALLFSMVIQCIIVILYLSSDVVYNTIISMATIGHEVAYLIPISCMLFGGRSRLSENRPWNLGKFGIVINVISFMWLCFISITTFFPTASPVTAGTMNYTIVIIFIVIFYATICYFVQGVKTYKGPRDVLDEEIVELDGTDADVVELENLSTKSNKQ